MFSKITGFIVVALLFFGIMYYIDRCNRVNTPPVQEIKKPDTSASDVRIAELEDSLYKVMIEKDELLKDKEDKEKLLDRANVEMKKLISNYRAAISMRDTPTAIINCDSIVEQNELHMKEVSDYQNMFSEYIVASAKEIDTDRAIISELKSQNDSLKTFIGTTVTKLNLANQELAKPKSKFVFGPNVSYSLTPFGLQPTVGLGITYRIEAPNFIKRIFKNKN